MKKVTACDPRDARDVTSRVVVSISLPPPPRARALARPLARSRRGHAREGDRTMMARHRGDVARAVHSRIEYARVSPRALSRAYTSVAMYIVTLVP